MIDVEYCVATSRSTRSPPWVKNSMAISLPFMPGVSTEVR